MWGRCFAIYKTGDLLVYGRMGVCRLDGVCRENGRDYFVLSPLYQTCVIKTPLDGKVPTRPVITKEETDALIDAIPSIPAQPCESKVLRELSEHYRSAIDSLDCRKLLELTMSIYSKKRAAADQNKKLGQTDERYMKAGEALLYGELAVALGIEPEAVPDYIAARLKARKQQ